MVRAVAGQLPENHRAVRSGGVFHSNRFPVKIGRRPMDRSIVYYNRATLIDGNYQTHDLSSRHDKRPADPRPGPILLDRRSRLAHPPDDRALYTRIPQGRRDTENRRSFCNLIQIECGFLCIEIIDLNGRRSGVNQTWRGAESSVLDTRVESADLLAVEIRIEDADKLPRRDNPRRKCESEDADLFLCYRTPGIFMR